MYFPKLQQFNNTEGVAYNNRATTKLQAGLVYSAITIDTNIVAPATITKLAIDLNGTEIVYASGADLRTIDAYRGTHTEAGRFTLDLARFDFKSIMGIRLKELITLPTDLVTLVVEFGAKDAADPATPTMSVNALVTDLQSDRYFVPSMHKFTRNMPADGIQELIFPNGASNRIIQSLMFDLSTVGITKLEVYRGDTRIYEGTKAQIEYVQKRYGKRTPQANRLFFEPTVFGLGQQNAMSSGAADSLVFKLTCSAGGQLPVVVEGFDQVKPLPQNR